MIITEHICGTPDVRSNRSIIGIFLLYLFIPGGWKPCCLFFFALDLLHYDADLEPGSAMQKMHYVT